MDVQTLCQHAQQRQPEAVRLHRLDGAQRLGELRCSPPALPELAAWLVHERGYNFAGLIVEERKGRWTLRAVFYGQGPAGWVHLLAERPLEEQAFPSLSLRVHAADWHEREAEDMFGLVFEGHPRLGDFILHDDRWPEGVEPMRPAFDGTAPAGERRPRSGGRPRRIVQAPGAFTMPVGPIFSGVTESVHFQLETVGEEVIRAFPRLFYKYRAVEKAAEGRGWDEGLLLAERFAASTAFAHALGFCQAVERLSGAEPPARALALRVFLAELERLRHHLGVIEEVCGSTGLAVATSQAALLEEEALRLCGALSGHRYLFGLAVPGGLARDLETGACKRAARQAQKLGARLRALEEGLRRSSSFLDRLEQVGIIDTKRARDHGLVGPLARASGLPTDLRRAQPYAGYAGVKFEVPCEQEGDGYARLRVLCAEAQQTVEILAQVASALPEGPVRAAGGAPQPGAALGWVEAPRGAAFHWVRLEGEGRIGRYRLIPPSFTNWHGFHLAAENFTFQDFPIILATLGLSVAENDR